ncbi:MAG: cation acetate symporter [Candidatus Pacebacteria bacterium]|nr:cation acetate symporter [Candidatus Paceibacterota bacterium]
MTYSPSPFAVVLFISFVIFVIGLSSYLARRTKTSKSYFAAGGTIHWGVNGIAFAGDYLSAASFLGICGLIATAGYDGFLYSIGFLAGWIVALFVVAEPMKRMGKYTFTDALDANFNYKGIQLMAAISTLIVSICYLVPQMVGAGVLVRPLLGLPHYAGVLMVGGIVIVIVATAGMTSTTYVQFLKGGLLIVFSTVLVVLVLYRGLATQPTPDYHEFKSLGPVMADGVVVSVEDAPYTVEGQKEAGGEIFVKLSREDVVTWWHLVENQGERRLEEALSITDTAAGGRLYNGLPQEESGFYPVGHMKEIVVDGESVERTGPVGPFRFLSLIEDSTVVRFPKAVVMDDGNRVQVYYQKPTPGKEVMRPGLKFKVDKGSTFWTKLDFASLMLALFLGTSALPHILIRYYTVPSPKCARKSTIVAIAAIGFFYILTLYMGLGAMVGGVMDVESNNMAAPLLAKSIGVTLFAVICAVAFATILGTVSGLIVAASGAVAHDLLDRYMGIGMSDRGKVLAGKIAAIAVGGLAIVLGILFKGMNVSFLVGLAFAVAASANLPAIMMLLFWKRTTAKGVAASILVGVVSAMGLILLSPSMFERYGMTRDAAPIALDQPGIISIPLSFITLIVVSLLTQKKSETAVTAVQ